MKKEINNLRIVLQKISFHFAKLRNYLTGKSVFNCFLVLFFLYSDWSLKKGRDRLFL